MHLILIPLFGLLRALDGADKISRLAMCAGMAALFAASQFNGTLQSIAHASAMFLALLWAFSYGWSLESAIHGKNAVTDWDAKFSPSGDFVAKASKYVKNHFILGALGWIPRILMTFWLPLLIAGNPWLAFPLALTWGFCYCLGGVIQRRVNRDIGTRIAEFLTCCLLGDCLIS